MIISDCYTVSFPENNTADRKTHTEIKITLKERNPLSYNKTNEMR